MNNRFPPPHGRINHAYTPPASVATKLQFHPGDVVRVVGLNGEEMLKLGIPLGWFGRFAKVTKAVEIYGGSYYYLDDNWIYRFPARALELIERSKYYD